MTIIGISGAIGHGKSSLADAFQQVEAKSVHLESFSLIAKIIDDWHRALIKPPAAGNFKNLNAWLQKLPEIIGLHTHRKIRSAPFKVTKQRLAQNPLQFQKLFQHLDLLRLQPELARQNITPTNKTIYRPILQWLGGFVTTEIDNHLWYSELVRQAQVANRQAKRLVLIVGVRFPTDAAVIRKRGGYVINIIRSDKIVIDSNDLTERERQLIKFDSVVFNNGSLDDLRVMATQILEDIGYGQLKPSYQAGVWQAALQAEMVQS